MTYGNIKTGEDFVAKIISNATGTGDHFDKLAYLMERCGDMQRAIRGSAQDLATPEFSENSVLDDNLSEVLMQAEIIVGVVKNMRARLLN